MESSVLWLIAGAAFVALEAFGASGVGFLFGGLAALSVALLIKAGLVGEAATLPQFIWFFGLTTAWAALLWKPVRRLTGGRTKAYSNLIGEEATVGEGGLRKGVEGQVVWSGTLMRAEMAAEEPVESLEAGAKVVISRVEGNKFFVMRKT